MVGRNVTRFKPGDPVFGTYCGALADYACASESALIGKPEKLTFEEAASVPVAVHTVLQGLRDKGQIQPGHKVLINGAGEVWGVNLDRRPKCIPFTMSNRQLGSFSPLPTLAL